MDNQRINRDVFDHIHSLMAGGFVQDHAGRSCYCGHADGLIRDWDLYFDAVLQLYMGGGTACTRNAVQNFFEQRRPDGTLPTRIAPNGDDTDTDGNALPFFAQTVLLCSRYDGGDNWLCEEMYQPLRAYLQACLSRLGNDGLPQAADAARTPSGSPIEWACYLYRDLLAISELAEEAGMPEDADTFFDAADELKAAILATWDEVDGFFYPNDPQTGEPIRQRTLGGLMPLWAGIISPRKAQILAYDHLLHPNGFWRPFPVPVAAGSNDARTGIPINYLLMHGLMNYGFTDLAELIAYKTGTLIAQSHDCAWYNAETGEGFGEKPCRSGNLLGYFMQMEAFEQFDPTDPDVEPDELYALMPYFRLPPVIEW